MDRLTKKAVITSSLLHGTLVLVLLVGPAFLPSEDPIQAKQIIDFIPFKTLETSMSGGGNPNVEQTIPVTPPTPTPPTPAPAPAPATQPERREEPPKREEPKRQDPPKSEPQPAPKEEEAGWKPRDASKIKVNLSNKVRTDNSSTKQSTSTSRNNDAAKALANAANNIGKSASSPVQIQEFRGPGGGGIPYAGFNDALVSAYMRAWLIPDDLASSSAKVKVSVTLGRDGRVISSRIQSRSGNSALDASVQRALDKVTFVAPFPASVKDAQKTFWLEFDPRAKRMLG